MKHKSSRLFPKRVEDAEVLNSDEFITAISLLVLFSSHWTLSPTVFQSPTLPVEQGSPVQQILFLRSHDPITQVRRARFSDGCWWTLPERVVSCRCRDERMTEEVLETMNPQSLKGPDAVFRKFTARFEVPDLR